MVSALPEWVKIGSQFFHPVVQTTLLAIAFYTLYLGIQVRKMRTAQGEEKKELVKGRYGQRHHQLSSILMAVLVLSAFGAMAVTYINYGKLVLGPHLIVGLITAGLIVTAAALVPYMLKGNIAARNAHVALNIVVLGLFSWQLITGLQIVQKIVSRMAAAS
jgi:MFS family permease